MQTSLWRRPERFGYNRLVATQFAKELAEQTRGAIDAIELVGSAVKPRRISTGGDIDLHIFFKTAEGMKKYERVLKQVKASFERKFGPPVYEFINKTDYLEFQVTHVNAQDFKPMLTEKMDRSILFAAKDSKTIELLNKIHGKKFNLN